MDLLADCAVCAARGYTSHARCHARLPPALPPSDYDARLPGYAVSRSASERGTQLGACPFLGESSNTVSAVFFFRVHNSHTHAVHGTVFPCKYSLSQVSHCVEGEGWGCRCSSGNSRACIMRCGWQSPTSKAVTHRYLDGHTSRVSFI